MDEQVQTRSKQLQEELQKGQAVHTEVHGPILLGLVHGAYPQLARCAGETHIQVPFFWWGR